jgi:hypothetical protein
MSAHGRAIIGCSIGLLLAPFSAAGCGGGPATYPVNGKVVWKQGGPATELAGYIVSFESEDKKTSGSGAIQSDGTFAIGTFAETDGAVPGKHRVALSAPDFEPDTVPPPLLIPQRYTNFDSSDLTAEIKPGTNDVVLEVEHAGRR